MFVMNVLSCCTMKLMIIQGFVVNASTIAFLGVSNGLSFKIIGAIKNVVVLLSGILLFGDNVTLIQAMGYTLSLVGFGLYTRIQMQSNSSTYTMPRQRLKTT